LTTESPMSTFCLRTHPERLDRRDVKDVPLKLGSSREDLEKNRP
jgi:hypothetical protein